MKSYLRFLLVAAIFVHTAGIEAKTKCEAICETYDYVIIGCGTAGSVLAAKLSDPDSKGRFKNSVCVLEAGVYLPDDPCVKANNTFDADISLTPINSRYTHTTQFNGTPWEQTEGIMWGGSSGHNGTHWFRATPDIYNQWAAISGDDRWLYENLLNNVMIPMEHYTPNGTVANSAQHGFNGPLFVTQEPYSTVENDPVSQAFATVSGAGLVTDLNDIYALTNGQVGVSSLQDSVTPPFLGPNSIRSYAANSFLTGIPSEGIPAIVDAKGKGLCHRKLKIVSNAWANRIIFSKNRRAKAVEYTIGKSHECTKTVKARKGIIACCGALYTPALLQRSGIGDAELLNSLDIPVVVDNKNVGAHLANHVGGMGVIDVESDILVPSLGIAFIGIAPTTDQRITQVLYANSHTWIAFIPNCVRQLVDIPEDSTLFLQLNVTPRSEGRVAIVSTDPFRQPDVNFNNYSDGSPSDPGSDANKIVQFYYLFQDIAAAAGANVLYPTPDQYAAGDEGLFQAAQITSIYAAHQSGTCRMGTCKDNGVVDGRLQVFGVKGLYVADCSTAPVIENCNTQTQAYFTGAELARILRGEA